MKRYADIASVLLFLQGIRDIWLFIALTLLSLSPSLITIISSAPYMSMEVAATFTSFMLPVHYLIIIIIASGKLARLGYSLKEPSIVELFTSRGIDMEDMFIGLWMSSSLRFLLFASVGGLAADITSYLTGALRPGEAVIFIVGLALSTSLISAIAILLSLFIPPGEAQYWIGGVLYMALGWIFQKVIWEWARGAHVEFGSLSFIRSLLSGFTDLAILGGEFLAIFIALVILVAVSGELTWEEGPSEGE